MNVEFPTNVPPIPPPDHPPLPEPWRLAFPVFPGQGARKSSGFSLIEVTLALAIVAFAFVAMLGLLAPGLSNFTVAMNTQTSAEIFQRVAADLQDSTFTTLTTSYPYKGQSSQYFTLPLRYFDVQGQEVKLPTASSVPTQADRARIVYTVRVRGSRPGGPDTTKPTAGWFVSLPSGPTATRFTPRDSTILTVQVILTQGRDIDAAVDANSQLITPLSSAQNGFPLRTYSLLVSRNGFSL